METHTHRCGHTQTQAQRHTHAQAYPGTAGQESSCSPAGLPPRKLAVKIKSVQTGPSGVEETLTSGFASKSVLENSSSSKFPTWLAEASFITKKKKKKGLISELGKHQSQLLDDLKKIQCFGELSSIRSNVPKASVCPNPPLSAVSKCSAAMLDAWATLCSVTTAFAYIS